MYTHGACTGASALVAEFVIAAVVGGFVEAGCNTEIWDSLYMKKT